MKTIKNANKGAVKTAKVSTANKKAIIKSSTKKGDPSKADHRLIEEYAAEMLLRDLLSVPKSTPMKTKLGANEVAYREKMKAAHEKELAKKRKHKDYRITLTSITCNDGKTSYVDSNVYKSIEEGIAATIKELCEMMQIKVPKAIKPTTKKYSYKGANGDWELNTKDGIENECEGAVLKCHFTAAGSTIVWYLQEHFGK